MTRKKFIKLLMSQGYSRNEAEKTALVCRGKGMPYEGSYELLVQLKSVISTILPNIGVMVAEAVENIQRMARAVSGYWTETVKAFYAAMSNIEQ